MDFLFPYISLLGASACMVLGIFVLSRNVRNPANVSFAFGMTLVAVMEFAKFLSAVAPADLSVLLLDDIRLAGELLLPAPWIIFSTRFIQPGSPTVDRLRRIGIGAVALVTLALFVVMLTKSPVGIWVVSDKWQYWMSVFLLLSLTAVIANFETTLRSADHARRWKLKYLFLGIGVILGIRIFIHSQHLLFPSAPPSYSEAASTVVLIGCAIIAFSLVRHQLLDVNVFISRYFAYNSFTVAAVGVYLLLTGLTAQMIREFGGGFTDYWGILFVVSSILLLLAALLSSTVRKRVQIFINRHFYRNRYDYHKEWLSLTERLGEKVDIRDLVPPILSLFRETVWVEKCSLWLSEDEGTRFRAVYPSGNSETDEIRWSSHFFRILREKEYPIRIRDLIVEAEPGSPEARQLSRFQEMGFAVIAPMGVGSRLVGILALGESRSGHPMDREDFDLIGTVAKQAASSFLGADLSRELAQAKEMEAFHSFSAFVLHDLKNFMTLLSLFVENADRNLDKPEFRADAIRGITQTLEKMKRLMDRLSALSREPDSEFLPMDLNALVREVLAELNGSIGSSTVESLEELGEIHGDPSQIRRILTNLILNADESMEGPGEIRLSTCTLNGSVVLTVEDQGCGMTPEFLENSLFKPFATTKSDGFGIGLYQVKRIVEAHRGEIEVESTVGRGTIIRIRFPQERR